VIDVQGEVIDARIPVTVRCGVGSQPIICINESREAVRHFACVVLGCGALPINYIHRWLHGYIMNPTRNIP
jgi:hypothetical protein